MVLVSLRVGVTTMIDQKASGATIKITKRRKSTFWIDSSRRGPLGPVGDWCGGRRAADRLHPRVASSRQGQAGSIRTVSRHFHLDC